jgi:peptidylamidoglycolate lyase
MPLCPRRLPCAAVDNRVLGQGQHRYRVVPGWVSSTRGLPSRIATACFAPRVNLILLTDHTANNVILYDKRGRLVSKCGSSFPGTGGVTTEKFSAEEGTRQTRGAGVAPFDDLNR